MAMRDAKAAAAADVTEALRQLCPITCYETKTENKPAENCKVKGTKQQTVDG